MRLFPAKWIPLLAAAVTIHGAMPAAGQIETLKKVLDSGSGETKAASAETPEKAVERLRGWQQEARETLAAVDNPGAVAALPAGVREEELEDYRRDLELLVLTTNQAIEDREKNEAGKPPEVPDPAAWTGFDDPPPYSILLLDEVLNERDAARKKLASTETSLSNYQHLLDAAKAEGETAEQMVGQRISELERAQNDAQEAAKWRLQAASARSRLVSCRVAMLESIIARLRRTAEVTSGEIAMLEKKAGVALANVRFDEDDIRKVETISSQRKAKIEKEGEKIASRIKTARETRTKAKAAVDALVADTPEDQALEGLEIARFRLDVAENRLDVLKDLAEGLENLAYLQRLTVQCYKDRLAMRNAASKDERARHLGALREFSKRLAVWKTALADEFATNSADLTKLEARASSVLEDDPRFSLLNEQRVLKGEKISMLQRLVQASGALDQLISRWVDDATPKKQESGAKRFFKDAKGIFAKIWDFTLFSFENTVELDDGKIEKGKVPVKVGMLIRAILFFVICYWLAARFADRIQKTLVGHKKMEDAQARTLRNWAMLAVVVLLAFATLHLLKIPLTVFAVLGGALAIGLGFGTQTLIKNFISGIIVLVERKVRVGDMIDVDGIIGRVIEVNARSSVLRGPDDVETVIPNSVFLENRFTNWTLSDSKIRRAIRVGVAYGSSPKRVIEALTEEAGRHGLVSKSPEPTVVFEDFGDNALVFCLYYWFDLHCGANALVTDSDLRIMIEKRLSEMKIGIPFPQRDVHLYQEKPIRVEWSDKPAETQAE